MKIINKVLSLVLLIPFLLGCKNDITPQIKTVEIIKELDPNATYAKAEFSIHGMTCQIGCAATIQKKISKMEGVKFAKVNFNKQLAMVEYDEAIVTPNLLKETVTKLADVYSVSNMKKVGSFSGKNSSKQN